MKIFHQTRVSVKITILYTVLFTLFLFIFSASLLFGVKYYLYHQADKQIKDVRFILGSKIEKHIVNISDKEFIGDIPENENIDVRIFADHTIVNEMLDNNVDIPIEGPNNEIIYTETNDGHFKYLNFRLQLNNQKVTIQIIKNLDNEDNLLKVLFIFLICLDAFGLIFSIIIGFVFSKRMLSPIDKMTKTAKNISINNLKERIPLKGPNDELNRLAKTLNSMIDRLQDSFIKQNQFVADASHELRTPIAVILGYANLLDRWGKEDEHALSKAIEAIKFESENMKDLVEKLLFLAKGDRQHVYIKKKVFCINDLIQEVVDETNLFVDNRHFIYMSNEKLNIEADYKLIKQMIRIFIDNAIKYTAVNGEIKIQLIKQNDLIEIMITDNGIGIPQRDLPYIFNRFYCVDKSRSKGTGLGLTIAKTIIDMHHGSIQVSSIENQGATFRILLPSEIKSEF